MANMLYTSFKTNLLNATHADAIDFTNDTIKAALVDEGTYTRSAAHQYLSSVSAGIVGTAATLTSKTTTGGVFDAADTTFTAVSGASCESILIYKDTGNPAPSPLIALIDTVTSGLPITPNGGSIIIAWDNGGNGVLKVG